MASEKVSAEYMTAGEDYLRALRKLGLDPLFMGWGREVASKQYLLVMVTSIIDAGGPLALNRLLFKAYNAEATPKAISPFIVRVYSPEALNMRDFAMLASRNLMVNPVKTKNPLAKSAPVQNFQFTFQDVEYEMINAYALPPKGGKRSYHVNLNDWQKFKRNVEKLAA